MKKRDKIKGASFYYLIGTLFNKGIGFITVPIFTRIMTVSDYGIVTTYNSWVGIISMFISLALYMAIRLSFVDYEKHVEDFLSSILLFTLFYGLCILGIVMVLSYLVPINTSLSIIILCILQSIGSALIEDISQFLMMKFEYKFRTFIMIIPNLLSAILSVILIRYLLSQKLYMGRIFPTALITFVIGSALTLYFIPKGRIKLNKEYLSYAFKISIPLILHGIALNILSQSDRTMITILRNARETGVYGLIYNFSMIATVITTAFDGIWVPFFMNNMKKDNFKIINKYSYKYIELMTIAMIGVILVGPEIVKIIATESYWEGIIIIPPIVLSNYLIFIYTFYVYIEHYFKKTLFMSINTMIAAVINIVLNYFFIIEWGYLGAAYSTLLSYGLALVLHYFYSRKLNKEVIPLNNFAIPVFYILLIVLMYYVFLDYWIMRWGIALLVIIILCVKEKNFLIDIISKRL